MTKTKLRNGGYQPTEPAVQPTPPTTGSHVYPGTYTVSEWTNGFPKEVLDIVLEKLHLAFLDGAAALFGAFKYYTDNHDDIHLDELTDYLVHVLTAMEGKK